MEQQNKNEKQSASLSQMRTEVRKELVSHLIPFWRNLKDEHYGGFYGWVSCGLKSDPKAEKGCILNSRITWFFANAYTLYKKGWMTESECREAGYSGEDLRKEAEHGYLFLKECCLDREYGGVYWSLNCDGTPADTTKHTYNQAFAIYAIASYYEAVRDAEALSLAVALFFLIEEKCTDETGYLEAFTREFVPESNEKLSENGVIAEKTMNTLLHLLEAYTELYRVTEGLADGSPLEEKLLRGKGMPGIAVLRRKVRSRLTWMMDIFAEKVYNPARHRQEVFFDRNYHPILDLHSYGHDIETAWLMDRTVEVLNDSAYEDKMTPITKDLTAQIYKTAFDGNSLANECENGIVNDHRIWWVQAEAVVGFLNGYEKAKEHTEYRDAAVAQWNFIRGYVVDRRPGSEWYWEVDTDGTPFANRPIVEPWKCPYHNGRMCMEVLKRC